MPDTVLSLVGLGANIRPRTERLKRALELLSGTRGLRLLAATSLRETAALGYPRQNLFLNGAALFESRFSAGQLLGELKRVQEACRRVFRGRWMEREVDLDLLLHGDESVLAPGLEVPHPGLLRRWFALCPAAELLPHGVHPLTGKRLVDHLHGVGPFQGGF